jgi:hypothetical protein
MNETQAVLEKRNVTPTIRLVKEDNKKEIRELFQKTLKTRNKEKEVQKNSDRYFLNRNDGPHLADDGEPYTGLKMAGVIEPDVTQAAKYLDPVSEKALIKLITEEATKDIRERFAKVQKARKCADYSVEAYREYMHEYSQFTHQAEYYSSMLKHIQKIIIGHTNGGNTRSA